MQGRLKTHIAVVGLGAMVLSGPVWATADENRGAGSHHQMRGEGADKDMKSRREQVRGRMEEQQRKLDELAAGMNRAAGQEKVDAMAALLNEMVAQRRAMRDRIADRMSKQKESGGDYGPEEKPDGSGKSR
jgi:hypothetical protein